MGIFHMRWIASCTGGLLAVVLTLLPVGPALASGEGGGVTVVPDWSFTLQIANFVFLIFALNFLLYRPIRGILKERQGKFKSMEASIHQAQQTLQEKEAAFAKAIRDARSRGLKEKENLVQQAEAEERKQMETINAKAQADLEAVRRKIQAEAESVRQSLQQNVGAFAHEIARKILGRAV